MNSLPRLFFSLVLLLYSFVIFVPQWTSVRVIDGRIEVKTNIPLTVEYCGLTYRVKDRLYLPACGGMVTVRAN